MKKHLWNFDSTSLTCDPALFPGTNIPNIAKSNPIFHGKGKEDKDFILTYLDSSMAEVFPHYCLFFSILVIFRRKRGVKVAKVLNLFTVFVSNILTSGENFTEHTWKIDIWLGFRLIFQKLLNAQYTNIGSDFLH